MELKSRSRARATSQMRREDRRETRVDRLLRYRVAINSRTRSDEIFEPIGHQFHLDKNTEAPIKVPSYERLKMKSLSQIEKYAIKSYFSARTSYRFYLNEISIRSKY